MKSHFQKRFHELLGASGKRINEVETATGIPGQTLRGWLKDSDRTPQYRTLTKIADYFGVTPESLTDPSLPVSKKPADGGAQSARITALESRLAATEGRLASLEAALFNLLKK